MTTQRDASTRLNLNVINLEALSADPVAELINDGDVWYVKTDSAHGKIKFAIGGAIVTIAQDGTVAVQ